MNIKRAIRYTTYVMCLVVTFSVGFSLGSLITKKQNADQYLKATEAMLRAQGDTPERVRTTLDLIKVQKQEEFASEVREHLAIWLPSVLVLINIIVLIVFERRKSKSSG
ncbi:MAG: hypothetical protein WC853_12255 [Thermodesulfovibrionales bacterium]